MMKIELVSYLFLSYLTLLVSGTPQFTTCPSDPVCLSQPVTYVCNSGAANLIWIVLDTNGDRFGTAVSYNEFVSTPNSIGSQFKTVLINNTNPLGANITFTPTLNISNYIVQCGDGSAATIVNCSIMIADVPIAAHTNSLVFGPLGTNRFDFTWTPQAVNPCLSHYILVITSAVDNINHTTTDTSLNLYATSTNNTLYTYTVLTVDTGGRSSVSPMNGSYIPNVPLSVTNLMLTQTNYPTDTNETVNITVSWNHPPSSPRPAVVQYHINYTVSDVPQNITVSHLTTSRTLSGFTVGSVYTVGVAGINIMGTGSTASATITILATPTPEIPSTSTSYSFTSVIRSTPSITPSSTPTRPTSTSTLGAGAIAGIAIAIIVLIAVLVISVIVIIYCVLKKNKDVAPQNDEAYNYTQVEPSAKSSSSKRQAPPKPPKAHSPPPADDQVFYSAVQKSGASRNAPEGGTMYADLDHGSLSSGKRNQKPKETNQVEYSAVSHNGSR